jgi:hypothetical protein
MRNGREDKKACLECGSKRRIFWTWRDPRVRLDRYHTLCPRCFRSLRDSCFSRQRAEAEMGEVSLRQAA